MCGTQAPVPHPPCPQLGPAGEELARKWRDLLPVALLEHLGCGRRGVVRHLVQVLPSGCDMDVGVFLTRHAATFFGLLPGVRCASQVAWSVPALFSGRIAC